MPSILSVICVVPSGSIAEGYREAQSVRWTGLERGSELLGLVGHGVDLDEDLRCEEFGDNRRPRGVSVREDTPVDVLHLLEVRGAF